jgi:hypothetical protein
MSLNFAAAALPVYPGAQIQLQGSDFGLKGTVTFQIVGSAPLQLSIDSWTSTAIFVEAPSIETVQPIIETRVTDWERVLSFPLTLNVTAGDGTNMGTAYVILYLGAPQIESVTPINMQVPGPFTFKVNGYNFGNDSYSGLYFLRSLPAWGNVMQVSGAQGDFYTNIDEPSGFAPTLLQDLPTCWISEWQSEWLSAYLQTYGLLLNQFITSRDYSGINLTLPASIDLDLVPSNPGEAGQEVTAFIVGYRNMVTSSPVPVKVFFLAYSL